MSSYTKCPNCAKEGLTVPMTEDGDDLVCSLCSMSYQKLKNT